MRLLISLFNKDDVGASSDDDDDDDDDVDRESEQYLPIAARDFDDNLTLHFRQ